MLLFYFLPVLNHESFSLILRNLARVRVRRISERVIQTLPDVLQVV